MNNVMTGQSDKVALSVQVLGKVVEAWKVGKAALALLVIGALLILAAFGVALKGSEMMWLSLAFLGLGAVLLTFVAYNFYLEAVVPAKRASKILRQNAELLDAVQDAALQLTEIITQMNDFALSHATQIVGNIDTAKDLLALIPGGNRILSADYFTKSDAFVRKIRSVAQQSRALVVDVHDSLAKSDARRLANHVRDLQEVKKAIEVEFLAGESS
jgi:energy-coupling factor transporter transmembrane protein EcfT